MKDAGKSYNKYINKGEITMPTATIGQPYNVTIEVKKGFLTLRIDLKDKGHLSKSEKSMVIATTSGNQFIPEIGMSLGVNLYKKV